MLMLARKWLDAKINLRGYFIMVFFTEIWPDVPSGFQYLSFIILIAICELPLHLENSPTTLSEHSGFKLPPCECGLLIVRY